MSLGSIKILFLQSHLKVGGSPRQVADLISALDKGRFKPVVCCVREAGIYGEQLRERGVTVYSDLLRFEYDLGVIGKIAEIMRRERIDILHNTGSNRTFVIGYLAALAGGVRRTILAIHSTSFPHGKNVTNPLSRFVLRRAHRIVMVAHAQKRFLCAREGIDAANVTVIHNGIPLSRLRSEKSLELSQMDIRLPDSKIVGIVARLVLEKDHRTFLRAAEILSRRLKNVFFLVVGDGPERRALERFAEDLGLAGRVRFLGNRDAIGEILPLFDVGILSSSDETFPVSIQEIMAFEKPVVVTDVGGVREMIDHGSEGYVVPPHNPTLLAESIYDLLTHAEKARSMGKQGCARIEREFTADKMAHEFEQLYEAVLAS